VISFEGHIDKFMGDAVMAVFRDQYHLDRAIDAALGVKGLFNGAESYHVGEFEYKPEVSIGINSGEMVAGNIGSETLKRLDFTVIGDAVNLAQRLQTAAKAGQILISEEVYGLAKESFICELVAPFVLKNKALPVVTYQVLE
jgi:adenylate cyclase